MRSYLYWYMIEPDCFKFGGGGQAKRRMYSHSSKLLNGYCCDPASLRTVAVPEDRVFIIETAVRKWLVTQGHPQVPLEIRATRTKEKEREQKSGRKRTAREIHSRNGVSWGDIDAILRQRIAAEIDG